MAAYLATVADSLSFESRHSAKYWNLWDVERTLLVLCGIGKDKQYNKMGKVDRLCHRVEPFAVLFWALGIVLANTWPCPPARHHSPAVQSAFPYMVILIVRRWRICSTLTEDTLPPPFSYLGTIYLRVYPMTCGCVVGWHRFSGNARRSASTGGGGSSSLHGGRQRGKLVLAGEGPEVVVEIVGSQPRTHYTTPRERKMGWLGKFIR